MQSSRGKKKNCYVLFEKKKKEEKIPQFAGHEKYGVLCRSAAFFFFFLVHSCKAKSQANFFLGGGAEIESCAVVFSVRFITESFRSYVNQLLGLVVQDINIFG